MLDELAFLEVIRQSPSEDGPRLIYADFLEEKGDSVSVARAEFIRLQCLIAGGQGDRNVREAAMSRELELLQSHWRIWLRPICQALGEPVPMGPIAPPKKKLIRLNKASFEEVARQERYFLKRVSDISPYSHIIEQYRGQDRDVPYLHSAQFRRGFVTHVALANKSYRNATHVLRMMERTPLEGLALIGWSPEQFKTLTEKVELSQVRTLELIYANVDVCRLVMACPGLAGLERLLIRQPFGDADLCDVLAGGETANGLGPVRIRELQLRSCELSSAGLLNLLQMPWVANLESLGFPDCSGPIDILLMPPFRPDRRPRLRRLDINGAAASNHVQSQLAEVYGTILFKDTSDSHWSWPEMYQSG